MSRLGTAVVITALSIASSTCADVTALDAGGEIQIEPIGVATLLLGPGGAQQMQFTARSSTVSGSASESKVEWRTTAPGVLSITANGLASARALGTAIIIARVGTMVDSVSATVRPVPAASLVIALDSIALELGPYGGSSRTLSTVMRDSAGHRLTSPTVLWRASDEQIATITMQGVLTAVGVGVTWVHASADARRDSSLVFVTATLGIASVVNVRMLGAQWTQGIQRNDGSIPMVSDGRAAVVNITTSATGSIATPTQFVLRLFSASGVPVHAETTSVSILSGATTNREPTLQFLVPSNVLRAGVRWDVVRDPNRLSPGGAEGAETFPVAGNAPLPLVTPSTLRIRFIPIVLEAHRDERGAVSAALLDYYLGPVRAFFPHGRIQATIGSAHRTGIRFGIAGYGGDAAFWAALVAELDTRRIADPEFADAYWVGVVRPPTGFTYSTFGGMGYVPRDGQTFGPGTRTSAVISANWFLNESHSRDLVAHELGHNLGRLHAPCGTDGSLDATFPDSRGAIGEGAHDTFAWERGMATGAAALSSGTPDMMGYCKPLWISAHTYSGMLSFRDSPTVALRAPNPRQRVLLVRGTVDDGVVHLDAPVVIDAAPSAPENAGAWRLEGLSGDGEVLFTWGFSLARWDHAPQIQPFAIALPFEEGKELRLVTLRVTGPSGRAELRLR